MCIRDRFSSASHFLRHLVYLGAEQRYGKVTSDIKARLDRELNVINHLGYADYFLVVWDLVKFATRCGIRHAGRGSAADSAVAYCLGITDVDPIAPVSYTHLDVYKRQGKIIEVNLIYSAFAP